MSPSFASLDKENLFNPWTDTMAAHRTLNWHNWNFQNMHWKRTVKHSGGFSPRFLPRITVFSHFDDLGMSVQVEKTLSDLYRYLHESQLSLWDSLMLWCLIQVAFQSPGHTQHLDQQICYTIVNINICMPLPNASSQWQKQKKKSCFYDNK